MTRIDRRRLLALGGAAVAGAATPAWARGEGDGVAAILAETGAPALIGAAVTAGGLQGLTVGGVRRLDAADRARAGDLWHLGSNAKAMTAALYGRLVEQGRAKWGATVPELFPDLAIDPAWTTTTVEQLMGHRAGVEERSIMQGGWLMLRHADTRPLREQRMEAARTMFGVAPRGTPGAFAYANLNYVIVGAAIERIADAPWEEVIAAELFRPLGMTSPGFGAPKGAQPWGHRAAMGGPQAVPPKLTPVDPAGLADNPRALGPAGGVHMTLEDHARFVRLFLTRGGGVLTPDTIEKLTTPVAGEGGAPYALGWGVATGRAWARGPVLAHEGSNTLWHAVAVVAPARGTAILTVSNGPPETQASSRLAKKLQDRFAPA